MDNREKHCSEQNLLLDSKHILTTILEKNTSKLYNAKVVVCGQYVQVYRYKNPKKISSSHDELNLKKIIFDKQINNNQLNFENIDNDSIVVNTNIKNSISKNNDNVINSMDIIDTIKHQNISMADMKDIKTFVTLTFAKNIIDIKQASKNFKYFVDKVQHVKKDFNFRVLQEYIKTDNMHIHLLTNIDINDKQIIYTQEDKTEFKYIKYWDIGFNLVENMKGDFSKLINNTTHFINNNIIDNNNIANRSIIRSKLECQRLAKSNMQDWKTFITLTFAENITDIKIANKKFRYFIDKVQRIKKDFKYICIPEFQKRGATHYHLLTNIDFNDKKLIFNQDDNPKFKHVKYWNEGFTKVDILKGDIKKIIGYISKYMTKDIDNRLFNRHRYFFSRNLSKPKVNFLNLDSDLDNNFYIKKIQDKDLIYQNDYINTYDNNQVTFLEFIKK